MSDLEKVRDLLSSFCSLFYLGVQDHRRVLEKCVDMASQLKMEVFGFNLHRGLWQPGAERVKNGTADPLELLDLILTVNREPYVKRRRLYLLEHFDLLLEGRDPHLLTRLRL